MRRVALHGDATPHLRRILAQSWGAENKTLPTKNSRPLIGNLQSDQVSLGLASHGPVQLTAGMTVILRPSPAHQDILLSSDEWTAA